MPEEEKMATREKEHIEEVERKVTQIDFFFNYEYSTNYQFKI